MFSAKQLLHEVKLKATPAREATIALLTQAEKPVDASEVLVNLKKREVRVDKVTIYRMLDTFFQKGIIQRLEFGEGKFRYELSGNKHHHLICDNCGSIEDISDCNISELEAEIQRKKHFLVKRHALEFYGLCQNCQR